MRKVILIFLTVSACISRPETNKLSWNSDDRLYLVSGLQNSFSDVSTVVGDLNEEQWNWQPDSSTWSIAMIVEHLIVHDELFYREARVLAALPEMTAVERSEFAPDSVILSYREITPQNRGQAPAYLQPLGRWCSKEEAVGAYQNIRGNLISFVEQNTVDFRKYYTTSGRGPTRFRDLHQLLLISIAHTQRHSAQIKELMSRKDFPSISM